MNINAEKKKQLKALFPGVFSGEHIDFERLKQALGEEIAGEGERYSLNWPGKKEARAEMYRQTTATLSPVMETPGKTAEKPNVFIEGENMEVLRALQKSYFSKIKMIYIDPPYNTGNERFIYADNFAESREAYQKRAKPAEALYKEDLWRKNIRENGQFHSNWLSMMYPRLYLARNLLRDDGVIFISIDDHEMANLKLICDELFGEENFVATVVWQRAFSPVNLKKTFSPSHEYVLVYAKNIRAVNILGLQRNAKARGRYKNPDNDPRGPWTSGGIDVGPVVAEKVYPITTPSGRTVMPPDGYCWRFTREKFDQLVADNRIWFGEAGNNVPRVKRFLSEVKDRITPMTLWLRDEVGDSQSASRELKKLFGGKAYFNYPKPVGLVQRCVELTTEQDDLILDFFAGSATTAEAVMQMNAKDGGNRRFILVQMPEKLSAKSGAYKAGFHTIADIGKARIEKAMEKLRETQDRKATEAPSVPPLHCYTLTGSHFKTWQPELEDEQTIAEKLRQFTRTQKEDSSEYALFTELRLQEGLDLHLPFHKAGGFYKTEAGVWFCLNQFKQQMLDTIKTEKPQKVIFLNSCFQDDSALQNLQLSLQEYGVKFEMV